MKTDSYLRIEEEWFTILISLKGWFAREPNTKTV